MKQQVLLCIISLLAFACPARAAGLPLALPTDTVAGHTHLVRRVSNTLCTRLASDRSIALDKLTPPGAMQLIKEMFTSAFQADSVALGALMAEAAKVGIGPQQVGQEVGKDVILQLSRSCPAALPLLTLLGQTEQVQKVAAMRAGDIGELEKKSLQPLANAMCTELTASNAKTPLLKLAPAQRYRVYEQIFDKAFAANRAVLLRYYSVAQLDDSQSRRAIGEKMSYLMMQQPTCAQHLMLLGADELSRQEANKQAAAPKH